MFVSNYFLTGIFLMNHSFAIKVLQDFFFPHKSRSLRTKSSIDSSVWRMWLPLPLHSWLPGFVYSHHPRHKHGVTVNNNTLIAFHFLINFQMVMGITTYMFPMLSWGMQTSIGWHGILVGRDTGRLRKATLNPQWVNRFCIKVER